MRPLRRLSLALVGLIFLSCGFRLQAFGTDAARQMQVGIASVDITPDYPVRLNGFGMRRQPSEGVRQHLYARAMAIGTGDENTAVILTVDTLGIPDDLTERLALKLSVRGIRREQLAICASHTHSGPMIRNCANTLFGEPIPDDHWKAIVSYSDQLERSLEQVALKALDDRRPASVFFGIGQAGFAVNRRTAGGPVDHDVPVLAIRNSDHSLRAVFVNYACHCVTLSDNLLSGDWAGYAMDHLQRMYPDCEALISIGCGADANPRGGVLGSQSDVADQLGLELAEAVRKVLNGSMTPMTESLDCQLERVILPLDSLPTRDEWLDKAKRDDAIGHHARTQLSRLDRGEPLMTEVSYPVQSISFGGELSMVFLPGEVVVDYATRLKGELDRNRLWLHAYSNACPGYIPSERILREGGYEGGAAMVYYDIPTRYQAGIEDKIVRAVIRQIGNRLKPEQDASRTDGIAPKTPREALASLQLKPEFSAELVAAEPLIESPVAIAFGPDGRLWVAEMSDYPQGRPEGDGEHEPGGSIRCLRDADHDGQYERSDVFLSGIPFPTGVTVWRDGVLVCAAPDILYAEDTDSDGRADRIEKLFTGFATHNYQARVNSLEYGLDGWVYGACGLFGGDITCVKTGQIVEVRQRDFRIDPDRGLIEPVSGGTQQGRVRNDQGEWFGCNNTTLLMHFPMDEEQIRRNPFLTPQQSVVTIQAGPDPGRLYPSSSQTLFMLSGPPGRPTAACGAGVYRDTVMGSDVYGNVFTCEPVNNLVHRQILRSRGATFEGRRAPEEATSEFLTSSDSWFRPVQIRTGPDGALWVVDMYRYVIEHPIWIPPDTLARLDTRAGANLGRIYRILPADHSRRPVLDLTKLSGFDLAQTMDSSNGTQRDLVQQLIYWRQDRSTLPELRRLATEATNPSVRLQAAWTWASLEAIPDDVLLTLLKDADASVRRHAVRLSQSRVRASSVLATEIHTRVSDEELPVRLQVAYAAGDMSPEDSIRTLIQLLKLETQRQTVPDVHLLAAVESSFRADTMAGLLEQASAISSRSVADRIEAAAAQMLSSEGVNTVLMTLLQACGSDDSGEGFDRVSRFLSALSERPDFDTIRSQLLSDPIESAMTMAAQRAQSEEAAPIERSRAIQLLGHSSFGRSSRADLLVSLLSSRHPVEVQSSAIDALRRDGSDRIASQILQGWTAREPRSRRECIALLLSRPTWTKPLLAEISQGRVAATELDLPQQQALLDHSDETIRAAAAISFQRRTSAARQEILSRYTAALSDQGDPAGGRRIYQKHCSVCHRIQDAGQNVGPEIQTYGSKPPSSLLVATLDPNQAVDPRYQSFVAVLKDGRSVTGMIAEEASASLTLLASEGKREVIPRTEIDEIRGTGKSLMPEGFEQQLSPQDLNDLIAWFRTLRQPPKSLEGNRPALVRIPSEGNAALQASQSEIYGGDITFELPFQNIGFWHGADDQIRWQVRAEKSRMMDVWAEWACAEDAQGNGYVLEGFEPVLRGAVGGTGGWHEYKLVPLGQVTIREGDSEVILRPSAAPRSALVDLRAVHLVAPGGVPLARGNAQRSRNENVTGKSLEDIVAFLLNDSMPAADRDVMMSASLNHASELISLMTSGLQGDPGGEEEYRRIPWIWRVAIAVGKSRDDAKIRSVLRVSLPGPDAALSHWQAVVIGGGLINGITLAGRWPDEVMGRIVDTDPDLKHAWQRVLKLSTTMVDDESVPRGTRYDALRMIALRDWTQIKPVFQKYLEKGIDEELQMGAVSGVCDARHDSEVVDLLTASFGCLSESNMKLAVEGLMRNPERIRRLKELNSVGKLSQTLLDHPALKDVLAR